MKKEFFQYYVPNEREFNELWKECYFVFDTNILINLYEFSSNSREDILKVFNNIKDRIWEPHQVIDEFFQTRIDKIISLPIIYDKEFTDLETSINTFQDHITKTKHPFLSSKYQDKINSYLSLALDSIQKGFDEQKKECICLENDKILNEITSLLKDKVGKPYSEKEMKVIQEEGAERYSKKIPPGFKDAGKPEYLKNGYGDFIIWKQIQKFAKEKKSPIIFITNDVKEDWWLIKKGKTISPRTELIKEIKNNSDVNFYMYKLENFLNHYETYYKKVKSKYEKINLDTFNEIRGLEEQKELINHEKMLLEEKFNFLSKQRNEIIHNKILYEDENSSIETMLNFNERENLQKSTLDRDKKRKIIEERLYKLTSHRNNILSEINTFTENVHKASKYNDKETLKYFLKNQNIAQNELQNIENEIINLKKLLYINDVINDKQLEGYQKNSRV